MPEFRVGDRVKRISAGGGVPEIEVGDIVIIRDIEHVPGQGQALRFEGHNRGILFSFRFELVQPEAPQARVGKVFYTIVFKQIVGEGLGIRGFENEQDFNNFKIVLQHRVVAEKKITLTNIGA